MLHSSDLPTRQRHARTYACGTVDDPRRHRLTASPPWSDVAPRAPRAWQEPDSLIAWAATCGDHVARGLFGHTCFARASPGRTNNCLLSRCCTELALRGAH